MELTPQSAVFYNDRVKIFRCSICVESYLNIPAAPVGPAESVSRPSCISSQLTQNK